MRNSLLQLVCLAKHLQNQIRVGPLLPKPISPLLWRTIHGHRPKYGQTVGFTLKTHTCGELTAHNVGETVTLRGFLQYQRMGKFAVLRDSAGQTQIILREENTEMSKLLNQTPFESYVEVKGVVQQRPEDQYNKNMLTGEIEILAHRYEVLSKVQRDLPFIIRSYNKPKENLRLQYRYLDLRHEELQRNLKLRSMVVYWILPVYMKHTGSFGTLATYVNSKSSICMINGAVMKQTTLINSRGSGLSISNKDTMLGSID